MHGGHRAVLVMHGDDDQIPVRRFRTAVSELLTNGTLKTYMGFPQAMPSTEADTIKADLLAFVK